MIGVRKKKASQPACIHHSGLDTSEVWVGTVLVFLVVVATFGGQGLGDTIHFGGDEGPELIKGLLVSHGYSLYGAVWSDQPPLYTRFLSALFTYFGENAVAARIVSLVATGFCAVFLFRMTILCGGELLGGIVSVAMILGVSIWVTLGVSAMQEVPMLATSLWSMYLLVTSNPGQSKSSRLIVAGLLMGVAIGIKFTAALNLLAAVSAFILGGMSQRVRVPTLVRSLGLYMISTVATTVIIAVSFGYGSFAQMVENHFRFTQATNPHALTPETYYLSGGLIRAHWDLFVGGVLGLTWLLVREPRTACEWCCVTCFAVFVLFAFFYRPWWDFYLANLSVPLILLTSASIGRLTTREIMEARLKKRLVMGRITNFLFAFSILAVSLTLNLTRLSIYLSENSKLGKVSSSEIIAYLREQDKSGWLLTQNPIIAFHSGLLVPPEYAVLTRKRFWSGSETFPDLTRRVLEQYRPNLMLIEHDFLQILNQEILEHNYVRVWMDRKRSLFSKED